MKLFNSINQYIVRQIEGIGEFQAVESFSNYNADYTVKSVKKGMILSTLSGLFVLIFINFLIYLCIALLLKSIDAFSTSFSIGLLLGLNIFAHDFILKTDFHKPILLPLLLHIILPGSQNRVNEIRAFFEARYPKRRVSVWEERGMYEFRRTRINAEQQRRAGSEGVVIVPPPQPPPLKPHIQYLKDLDEEMKNLPEFVKNNFSNSQSLTRFIGESLKNEKGELNVLFLRVLLLIPKRKTLSVDTLRSIIQSAKQLVDGNLTRELENTVYINLSKSPEIVAEKFKDYSESDLKTLLTNRYSAELFFKWIHMVAVQGIDSDPKAKFLYNVVENKPRALAHKNLLDLEKSHLPAGVSIKVFNLKSDFEKAKEHFKNCILSYYDRPTIDTFGLYKNGQPWACVSIDTSLNPVEIKAPFNNHPDTEAVLLVKKALSEFKAKNVS